MGTSTPVGVKPVTSWMDGCTDLRLPGVLVLGQVDPGDGAEGSEELLQVCLAGILGQVGHTDGGIVVSCEAQTFVAYSE